MQNTTCKANQPFARTVLFAAVALLALSTAQADDRGYRHNSGDHGARLHEGRRDHRFYDTRYHHNRYYPARGHIVTALPARRTQVIYGGVHFFFSDGIWFRGDGRRFVVVAPPLGIHIRVLPNFYTSLWIGGVPYYYANNVYYVQSAQGYVVAQPPAGQTIIEAPAAADSTGDEIVEQPANEQVSQAPVDLYVYPARGQNEKQLAADRNECHAWAVKQAGYDPNHASTGFQVGEKQLDYDRAITACLEGRGYTVK